MKLTVLGSGAALFNPKTEYRYPASHLIEVSNCKILLDAGIGVLPQITKLGLLMSDISVIAISHFHADHFTIQPLLQAYFLEGKFKGNKPTLHILGPTGIEERARIGFDQSGFSYIDDFVPNVNIQYTEYKDREKVELNEKGVSLIPFKTTHFELEAYSLRIEADNKTLAYSGDSTISDGLQAAAQDVDLFLCEAASLVENPSDQGHLNPHDAAEVAARAGSKKLILIHYSGNDASEAILKSAHNSSFTNEVIVTKDLDTYEA